MPYARPLFWRVVGVLYPLAVALTIVFTGNHFIFDALVGYLVMVRWVCARVARAWAPWPALSPR